MGYFANSRHIYRSVCVVFLPRPDGVSATNGMLRHVTKFDNNISIHHFICIVWLSLLLRHLSLFFALSSSSLLLLSIVSTTIHHVVCKHEFRQIFGDSSAATRDISVGSLRRLFAAHASLFGLFIASRRCTLQMPRLFQTISGMSHGTQSHGKGRFESIGIRCPSQGSQGIRPCQGKGGIRCGQTHRQGIQMVVAKK